jgi:hypothetical protein
MDTETTIRNDLLDFLNTNQARIIDLKSAPSEVAAIVDGEDKRVKDRSVFGIKGTVNKDAVLVRGHSSVIPISGRKRIRSVRINLFNSSIPLVDNQASFFSLGN